MSWKRRWGIVTILVLAQVGAVVCYQGFLTGTAAPAMSPPLEKPNKPTPAAQAKEIKDLKEGIAVSSEQPRPVDLGLPPAPQPTPVVGNTPPPMLPSAVPTEPPSLPKELSSAPVLSPPPPPAAALPPELPGMLPLVANGKDNRVLPVAAAEPVPPPPGGNIPAPENKAPEVKAAVTPPPPLSQSVPPTVQETIPAPTPVPSSDPVKSPAPPSVGSIPPPAQVNPDPFTAAPVGNPKQTVTPAGPATISSDGVKPNDIPPIAKAPQTSEPPAPEAACPWTLRVEIIKGRTLMTAQTGQEVQFRVSCDKLELQSPRGSIQATGNVKVESEGLAGSCDQLMIAWQADRVILEGRAELRCHREGQEVDLKAAQLSLRLSVPKGYEPAPGAAPERKGTTFLPRNRGPRVRVEGSAPRTPRPAPAVGRSEDGTYDRYLSDSPPRGGKLED